MGKSAIYINDSLHGLIRLSEYEKRIISSIGFNRLHDVYQNSTVYLTYPSNRTKRFEHSIGTMKLCTDMFYQSISNAPDSTLECFFKAAKQEIDNVVKSLRDGDASRFDAYIREFPRRDGDYFSCVPENTNGSVIEALIPHNVSKEDVKIIAKS